MKAAKFIEHCICDSVSVDCCEDCALFNAVDNECSDRESSMKSALIAAQDAGLIHILAKGRKL